MVEREKQNQWEGLNQSQRQSQERGCLMLEGENRGNGLWLGRMRGLGKDRGCRSWMIECLGQNQWQGQDPVCGMVEGEYCGLCLS